MLQLVNLSNYCSEAELIHDSADVLRAFLNYHRLDGVEMMFCGPWDARVHRQEWIHGVHLRFWPSWLDFWHGNQAELLRQFGSQAEISSLYGGLTRAEWLQVYRDNIRMAYTAGAKYVVFHVCNARMSELFDWKFHYNSRDVIAATVEVINVLAEDIPADLELLFENLWWPGLTLEDKELTAMLLDGVKHGNCGIMLDTGHLMNTNLDLTTEAEGVDYILETVEKLGLYRHYIKGLHLHRSLSGQYVKENCRQAVKSAEPADIFAHIAKIDEHLPFSSPEVRRIIDYVQPQYVVHEFINKNMDEWSAKVRQQQKALQLKEER